MGWLHFFILFFYCVANIVITNLTPFLPYINDSFDSGWGMSCSDTCLGLTWGDIKEEWLVAMHRWGTTWSDTWMRNNLEWHMLRIDLRWHITEEWLVVTHAEDWLVFLTLMVHLHTPKEQLVVTHAEDWPGDISGAWLAMTCMKNDFRQHINLGMTCSDSVWGMTWRDT